MNITEALKQAQDDLKKAKTGEPQASAEVLLSDVLNLSRTELIAKKDRELTSKELKKFEGYLKRRKEHEPVWQIIGKVNFWSMSYQVTKDVLVPRPETEILVKEVVGYAKKQKRTPRVLDLGTGSGTIAIALKKELNICSLFASDVSTEALKVAKRNAEILLGKGQISFKKGDLLTPWKGQKFDIIVANLPYIPHEDMASLSFDVLHHEPRVALDGGKEGVEIYERFFQEVPAYLNLPGAIFVEIGIDQGTKIKDLAGKYLPQAKCQIFGDLAGIDRVGIIRVGK